MFPLQDSTPRDRFPFINYLLILTNVVVFLMQVTSPNIDAFIFQYAFIPVQFSFIDPASYSSIFTSIFIHGGLLHLISNIWFLHIFGDNVEDRLGHIRYLLFYLAAGVVATIAQYVFMSGSPLPMIGASGAVSAAAGAYFVFFRHSRVKTLVTLFIIWTIVDLPATVVLGYWFLSQIFAGVGSLASVDINQGGVAFFAHIGGFVFGYFVARFLRQGVTS